MPVIDRKGDAYDKRCEKLSIVYGSKRLLRDVRDNEKRNKQKS
jgi:hypothetical protein